MYSNVVDDFTRESIVNEVDTSISGERVGVYWIALEDSSYHCLADSHLAWLECSIRHPVKKQLISRSLALFRSTRIGARRVFPIRWSGGSLSDHLPFLGIDQLDSLFPEALQNSTVEAALHRPSTSIKCPYLSEDGNQ